MRGGGWLWPLTRPGPALLLLSELGERCWPWGHCRSLPSWPSPPNSLCWEIGISSAREIFKGCFWEPQSATAVALRKMRFFFFFPCILNCRCPVAGFLQAAPTHRHTKLRFPPSFPLRCPERSPTANSSTGRPTSEEIALWIYGVCVLGLL